MKTILLTTTTAALFAAGCATSQPRHTAQESPTPAYQQTAQHSNWVGEQGPAGPTGAQGPTGQAGQTGPEGYAVAGPRGPAGPAGPAGQRGATGARGSAGELVRGPTGEVGPAGASGAQGQMGRTGSRGASADGYAGPAGPAGPRGPVGPTGATGEQGDPLVGPAGRAGHAGATGARGETGQVGRTGSTTAGVAGPTGVAGPAGPRGEIGPMGPVGATGFVENWTPYREFWFGQNMTQIHKADRYQAAEIASYMQAHPTLQVGIDNWARTGTSQRMRNNRINAIRSALIDAGVEPGSIMTGSFGDAQHRRDGRVGVLLRTDRLAYSQAAPSRNAQATSNRQSGSSQAQSAVNESWSTLQNFWFDSNKSTIHPADMAKVTEIATYMKQNPSLQIGIDSTLNANDNDYGNYDRDLAENRGEAVQKALIAAGVSASKIESGAFGDNSLRRDGRVEVFVRMDQMAQAQ